jgi:uncharacterized membrane protein (UPF0127 family)
MVRQLFYNGQKKADIFIADTFVKRFLGYMFRKQPHYEAILIKPCSSIHTFFMKFDIDVLFLNMNNDVIKKIEKLGPGRMIMPVKDAAMVIEARSGMFTDIVIGNKVTIQ